MLYDTQRTCDVAAVSYGCDLVNQWLCWTDRASPGGEIYPFSVELEIMNFELPNRQFMGATLGLNDLYRKIKIRFQFMADLGDVLGMP